MFKLLEGNLEQIKFMFCDEEGEFPSLRLSDPERSGITLADIHDIENEENIFS